MGTGITRFVLLSAVLHVGLLAALGNHPSRPPQQFTSSEIITLNEISTSKTPPRRMPYTHKPSSVGKSDMRKMTKTHSVQRELKSVPPGKIIGSVSLPAPQQERRSKTDNLNPSTNAHLPNPAVNEGKSLFETQADLPTHSHAIDRKSLMSIFTGRLRDAMTPYFTYPMLARRYGWQGRVQVGLRVEPDGHLSHIRIARSSGVRLLDNAAIAALNHIDALPDAVGWLDGHHFDMVLPIDYRLVD